MSDLLLLPGDPDYEDTLATTLPFDWQEVAAYHGGDYGFVVDAETGLLRIENSASIQEYVEGGEYDERLAQIDELE